MRIRVFLLAAFIVLAGCAARNASGVRPATASAPRGPGSAASAAATPSESPGPTPSLPLKLPLKPKSVRFAVIGDTGTGESPQFEVARQMETYRRATDFNFVIMLGDNIYGGDSPNDFSRKFEQPYKALLDAGVKFYASLGNHDNPDERQYKLFNMGGERYYTFKKNDVAFFVLDSTYMSPAQLNWLDEQLRNSKSAWKICYFHHSLYSDGKFHGSDLDLRSVLTPIFRKYGVNAVFSGHDHVYERVKPQNDIYYFVVGNSGQLRYHNLRPSAQTQVGFDTDQDFMLVEIEGDELYFQAISRTGATIDSGVIQRQAKPANPEPSKP